MNILEYDELRYILKDTQLKNIMIEYLTLILAIPLGFLLAHTTKDEKGIYSQPPYFPILLWVLAISASVFYTLDKQIALTLTFVFITTFVWNRA